MNMDREQLKSAMAQIEAQSLNNQIQAGNTFANYDNENDTNDFTKLAMELKRFIDEFIYTLKGYREVSPDEWLYDENLRLVSDKMAEYLKLVLLGALNPNGFLTNYDSHNVDVNLFNIGESMARHVAKNWDYYECKKFNPNTPVELCYNIIEAALRRALDQGERKFWRPQSKRIEHVLGGMKPQDSRMGGLFKR